MDNMLRNVGVAIMFGGFAVFFGSIFLVPDRPSGPPTGMAIGAAIMFAGIGLQHAPSLRQPGQAMRFLCGVSSIALVIGAGAAVGASMDAFQYRSFTASILWVMLGTGMAMLALPLGLRAFAPRIRLDDPVVILAILVLAASGFWAIGCIIKASP